MRLDEDKCSINKSNSGIVSFLGFTANITGPLAHSLHRRAANRVARLVDGKGLNTCNTHTHTQVKATVTYAERQDAHKHTKTQHSVTGH